MGGCSCRPQRCPSERICNTLAARGAWTGDAERLAYRAAVAVCLIAPAIHADVDPKEFFEGKVRPVLAKNCFGCHTNSTMGGLEMGSREALLKGVASGPAIVPGDPEASLLMRAVRHTHERIKMPPVSKLSEQEIADLAAWIKAGAIWPEGPAKASGFVIHPEQRQFWSFRPVRKPAAPKVRNQAWCRSAIDRFVLARLEEAHGVRLREPEEAGHHARPVRFSQPEYDE